MPFKAYEAWIALRYLKVRSREFFISLISWISVGGVAVGVAALIVVMSVMGGLEGEIRDKILGANSHCLITPATPGELTGFEAIRDKAASLPGVTGAFPYVDGRVMLMADRKVQGVEIRGFDPAATGGDLGGYLQGVRPGEIDGGDRPGVFIGKEMALNWGLMVGDTVKIVSSEASSTPMGPVPRFKVFRVAGYFVTGMYEYDTGRVYMSLPEARNFMRMDKGVSGVELKLADVFTAKETTRRLQEMLGPKVLVRDWTEMNSSLFGALKLEKFAMYLILCLIIVVAAFNIASTLTMVVMDKAKDIGILMSMGMSRTGIRNIFLIEGGVIGLSGAAAGGLLGTGLSLALKKWKFISLPQDVYYNATLPVVLDLVFVAAVAFLALALCLLAAYYPSSRASRLDPVETLRY